MATYQKLAASQKERIKRIVALMSLSLDVCFDDRAPEIIFVVRDSNTKALLTPAINWTVSETASFCDDLIKVTIGNATTGRR